MRRHYDKCNDCEKKKEEKKIAEKKKEEKTKCKESERKPFDLKHWSAMFHKMDTNGDGKVTKSELKTRLNDNGQELSSSKICSIFQTADKNRDGSISLAEFIHVIQEHPDIRSLFKVEPVPQKKESKEKKPLAITSNRTCCEYVKFYSFDPSPLFMIFLSVCQVMIYALSKQFNFEALAISREASKVEFWRNFTTFLMHIDNNHLFKSLVYQLFIGFPLEMVHRWRIMFIYLGTALTRVVSFYFIQSEPSFNGSNAVSLAFVSVNISNIILNWREMFCIKTQILVSVLMWLVTASQILTQESGYFLECQISGFLLGFVFLRKLVQGPWEKVIRILAFILYILLLVGIIVHGFLNA